MRNIEKLQPVLAAALIAAVILVVLSCRLNSPRHGWGLQQGTVPPHQTFPGDCGVCHVGEGWKTVRKDLSFDHEKEAGYRLEGAHARAACLRCHNDRGPVTAYAARGCRGCHSDPHASALGSDCVGCHGQARWKPVKLAAGDIRTWFHWVPAHSTPPCGTCHTEAGVAQAQRGPAQCAPCHQDGALQSSEGSNAAQRIRPNDDPPGAGE